MHRVLREAVSAKTRREDEDVRQKRLREQEELKREREQIARERESMEAERLLHQKQIEKQKKFQAEHKPQPVLEAKNERQNVEQKFIKTEILIDTNNSQIDDETEHLIPKSVIDDSVITQPTQTQPSVTQPSAIQTAPETFVNSEDEFLTDKVNSDEFASIITLPAHISEKFPEIETSKEASDEITIEKQQFVPVSSSEPSKKKNAGILSVVIIVLLIFGGAVLAAVFVFNNSRVTTSDNSAVNSVTDAPNNSQSSNYNSANANIANENTASNENANKTVNKNTDSIKIIPQTKETPDKQPMPRTQQTPQPQNSRPPKPEKTVQPKTPPQNPDCIFNGDC